MSNSQNNQIITEPESRSNGVGHSEAQGLARTGGRAASSAELAQALAMSQQQVTALQQRLAELEQKTSNNTGSSDIMQLATAIMAMAANKTATPTVVGPTTLDDVNRTTDFQTAKFNVDGRSMQEAQQAVIEFRNETKKPISIPRSLSNVFGPTLDITVNGVRVSIPCDGQTHFINETHWEHARERMAKVDAIAMEPESQVKEIG